MQTNSDGFHSHRAAKLHPKTAVLTPAKEPIFFRLSPLILIGEKNSPKSPSSPTPKPSPLAAAWLAALSAAVGIQTGAAVS